MINVFIDTLGISQDFFLEPAQIRSLVDFTVKELTARFAQELQNEANRELKSARQQYLDSIVVVDDGFGKGSVVLVGWLANAIEDGKSAYDMKPDLLSGPNAKTSKSGSRYNTIPFTFGTPGALPENFSSIMPSEIHQIVKKESLEVKLKGGAMASKGLTIDKIPKQFQEPQKKLVKIPASEKFAEYQHKNSIYEGMRKVSDPVTGQNSYQSFRRVSDNSDPLAWIHPGIEAKNISDKVLADFNVPAETGLAIDKFLSNL
jgi:hypothetical protein